MDIKNNDDSFELWYFAPITDVDKSGYLWIAGILSLVYILSFTLLRLFTNRRQLRLNDWVSVAATVAGIIQCCCLFVAISAGLGQTSSSTKSINYRRVNQAIYATIFFFIAAHTVAKVSMALLSQKLFGIYKKGLCNAAIGVAASFGIVTLLILLPKWDPACADAAPFATKCYPSYQRWFAAAALDLVTELILFSIPAISLYPLRMTMSAKAGVMSAFGSRLVCVVPMFVSVVYIQRAQEGASHPLSNLAALAVIQITLSISLITTNASALRSLTRPIKSVLGGSDYNGYRYGDQSLRTTMPSKNRTGKGGKSAFDGIQVQTEIHLDSDAPGTIP
ncbi:hypothetical protein K461DRAFT_280922 [Myriangium duriaei CBS 260.36]|uniref:Rhodopsin domain-containing protein n=1 Tax=Myriangium duriaei CBS 260.36 TaxID=1168546 RepID=A0A9P4IVU6_9PEZI|nr:hypothetical protein K461DRAFT_280922 [Myriangium duriaei CBS 260.36]